MEEVIIGRNEDDIKKYQKDGTIFLGKHLVGSGDDTHLTTPVLLDVVRPHIITLCGKRGEGKSYSMGVIAEGINSLPEKLKNSLSVLIIDTQGIFWTMKSPNEKQIILLKEWGLEPKGIDATVYVPDGQSRVFSDAGVDFDSSFSFMPSELKAIDWTHVFGINPGSTMGALLQVALEKLHGDYSINGIIKQIEQEKGFEGEKLALINMFEAAKSWGIFGSSEVPDILVPGKISILDVSLTPQNVRSLLVALLSRKIFEERTKSRRKEELSSIEAYGIRKTPMPWILIDEAHNFIPSGNSVPSTDILSRIVKEGRQPGITLVLATQRPEKLDPDALAQCDMIISHRLTAKQDIDALKQIMQTYMLFDVAKYINELPKIKGVAIVLDDNSERIYKIKIRPRQSWHAGESPTAV
jgi:uncharacterized protein